MRKKLYEVVQALEGKISQQNKIIEGFTTRFNKETSKINPLVVNSCDYETVLSVQDQIQSVSAFVADIPELGIPSNKLEFLMYLYGALCFFKHNDRTMVATFSKSGDLNALGDLTEVIPIDFAGRSYNIKKTVVYTNDLIDNPCVIISDYTGAYTESQIIPRKSINAVSISDQAYVYSKMRNAVKLTAKKAVALAESESQRSAVEKSLDNFFSNDSPISSVVGSSISETFKLLNIDTKLDIEGYLRAIEAYERTRANFNCIPTRSSLDKKERLITSEAENDNVITEFYTYDRLINRQIGIELMKKHSIIKEGSWELNPLLKKKKEEKRVQ